MSRVLALYLLRRALLGAALALAALSWVYLACLIGDQGRRAAVTLGWSAALRLMAWHLPLVAVQLAPAAVLLGGVLALSASRQRLELAALAAVGASRLQLAAPLLATGALATVLSLTVAEGLVPRCEQRADRGAGPVASSLTGVAPPHTRWLTLPGAWVMAARAATPAGVTQRTPTLTAWQVRGSSGRGGRPRLVGPLTPTAHGDVTPVPPWAAARALDRLLRERPEALSTRALLRQRRGLAQAGHDPTLASLVLHTRLAFPWLCLVLGGVAAALVTGRGEPGAAWLLGRALAWLAASWLAVAGGWLLGRTLVIGPIAAAWGPVLAIGLAGLAAAAWDGHALRWVFRRLRGAA